MVIEMWPVSRSSEFRIAARYAEPTGGFRKGPLHTWVLGQQTTSLQDQLANK